MNMNQIMTIVVSIQKLQLQACNLQVVVVLNASIIQIIADVFNAPIFTQVSEYWPFFQLELLLQTLWHDVFRIRNEFLFAIPSALNSALLFSCSIAQLSNIEPYFQ